MIIPVVLSRKPPGGIIFQGSVWLYMANVSRLYVSAIFDCFDLTVLGLAMDDNLRAELCVRTLDSAAVSYPVLRGAVVHFDRGS